MSHPSMPSRPIRKNAHYAATKAAVVSLTRSFALEFAPDQILVNAIAPAGIATEKAKGAGFLPRACIPYAARAQCRAR